MNVCYPNFAYQTTPRRFEPLWNPCPLPKHFEDNLEEASQCMSGGDEMERHACVREALAGTKLRYLGAGYSRAGYAFNGCIAKIAMSHEGVLANQGEFKAWREIGSRFTTIFAPVHDHAKDFSWITQPRLVPIHRFDDTRVDELKYGLEERMKAKGLYCGDTHGGNIGVRSGKAAKVGYLYDYGFGLSCKLKTPSGERMITVRGAPD